MESHELTAHGVTQRAAHDMAARLLRGAGRASLVAYADPELADLETLAHCWSDELGGLLVAVIPPRGRRLGAPVQVRLGIDKLAPLASVGVLTASLHSLAELWPLGRGQAEALADPPAELAGLIGCDDVLLALVLPQRLLLHAHGQVAEIDRALALQSTPWPLHADELAAVELVESHGEAQLAHWASMVSQGDWPGDGSGVVLHQKLCTSLAHRAMVVDVAPQGLTVMVTTADRVQTVQVDFAHRVGSLRALRQEVLRIAFQNPALPELWDATESGA
ncbi:MULTISPECIES: hypothetical protein [unclassified Luteococcus]|uniref:hypothetical protein n=1 Tax=unclassified Luteococcus TaxID=2639923 RepID=UPI00313EFCE1